MSDDAPSWVVAPDAPAPRAPRPRVPLRLRLLVVVVLAVAVAEAVHVAGRDDLVAGFRIALGFVVLLQVPLAVLSARRWAAAACGLFVYLATTGLAAVAGGFGDRIAITAGAALAAVLLATSLDTFPTVPLPPIRPHPDGP
jgi:hypothetical protein